MHFRLHQIPGKHLQTIHTAPLELRLLAKEKTLTEVMERSPSSKQSMSNLDPHNRRMLSWTSCGAKLFKTHACQVERRVSERGTIPHGGPPTCFVMSTWRFTC